MMTTETLCRIGCWVVGLVVALIGGHYATKKAWAWVHGKVDRLGGDAQTEWMPEWIGQVERSIFVFLVAGEAPNLVTAAIAWIALKLAVGWQRGPTPTDPKELARIRARALAGLLSSTVSLTVAAVGGLLCRGPRHIASIFGFLAQ